jgi:hypothetical protein
MPFPTPIDEGIDYFLIEAGAQLVPSDSGEHFSALGMGAAEVRPFLWHSLSCWWLSDWLSLASLFQHSKEDARIHPISMAERALIITGFHETSARGEGEVLPVKERAFRRITSHVRAGAVGA